MDMELFKKTFMPYHQKLFRIAYRIVGDEAGAKDVVQDTFVKLWNSRDKMSQVDNTEAYAVVILKNVSFDYLRKKEINTYAEYDNQLAEDVSLPAQIEHKDQLALVKALLAKLPQQQRQVFEMRHIDDCEMDEISELTGLSLVNIRVILSRVRKTIRDQFKQIEK